MSKKRRARASSSHTPAPPRTQATAGERHLDISTPFSLEMNHITLVFAPAVLLLALALDYRWVTEDAYITLQSVENLWAGYGPNFNRGLRVESFSHPLWFMLLSLLRVAGAEVLPLLSALVGIALTVSGLALASEAARLRLSDNRSLVPFGAIAISALPPFWQFASSGLETGLTFFWIGLSSLLLSREIPHSSKLRLHMWWMLGLGPIIRPDLGVFSIPFFGVACAFLYQERASRWEYAKATALFALPGLAWQIFRMGYYAALVPNTYLAKEGLGSRWDQGLIYLQDLCSLYILWPLLLVGITLVVGASKQHQEGISNQLRARLPVYALWIGAAVHGFFVCRSGGDFMHARLLLPALFALLASCAVVQLPHQRWLRAFLLGVFVTWCGYVALIARPTYTGGISPEGIADERQYYVQLSRTSRPVSLKDYELTNFYRIGESATRMAQQGTFKAMYWAHIGITVAIIPDEFTVIDPLALNDHIGSRIELTTRGRPGHEKIVPAAWFLARYPPGTGLVVTNQLGGVFTKKEPPAEIELAKIALQTPLLRELTEAVSAPMTPTLFARNITRAWKLTFLKIPPRPEDALKKFLPIPLGISQSISKPIATIPVP